MRPSWATGSGGREREDAHDGEGAGTEAAQQSRAAPAAVRARPARTARAVAAIIAANEPIQTGTAPRSAARPAVVSIVLSPSSARKNATPTPRRPGPPGRLVLDVELVVGRAPGPHREAEEQQPGADRDGPVGEGPAHERAER